MNEPSSSLSPENQHFADTVQLWNQITNKHAVDALLKFMSEEAKTSAEDTKRFAAMWDNVPPEHTITLNAEESKAFAEWLNNPPPLNEKLVELMTNESVLEKLRRELYDQIGVPKHLAEGDLPPNV